MGNRKVTTTFDTLGAVKRLEKAGFEREHAEAIVKEIHESHGDLVTRSDIGRFEVELKIDLKEVRNDLKLIKWGLGFNIHLNISIIVIVTLD